MSVINNNLLLTAAAGATGYQVTRSLRFNGSVDSTSLTRTPASAGNRKTWTWSGWIKRASLGSFQMIFGGGTTSNDTDQFVVYFGSSDTIRITSGVTIFRETAQVFRDPSSWYHFVIAVDTTQGTANDRIKFYVNGTQVTTFSTTNNPAQNADTGINTAAFHAIGRSSLTPEYYFNGYLAEIHLIDGQQLTPSSFGETDSTTGQWIPRQYSGSFGSQGFKLTFADNSAATAAALGKDSSGNSPANNWTPTNFTVANKDYNTYVSATGTGGVNSKSNAFDNDLNTFASSVTAGSSEGAVSLSLNFASIPVTVSSTVRVYFNAGGGANVRKARINGGSYVNSNSSDYADFSFTGTLSTIDSTLGPGVGGGYSATIAAIDVDGVRLVSSPASNIDSTVDTPSSAGTDSGLGGQVTGNYATLNPLQATNATLTDGNLRATGSANNSVNAHATFGITTGKWYWEWLVVTEQNNAGSTPRFGVCTSELKPADNDNTNLQAWTVFSYIGGLSTSSNGTGNVGTLNGPPANWANNDIVMIAVDYDAGKLWMGRNGTWFNSWNATSGTNFVFNNLLTTKILFPFTNVGLSAVVYANFGQRQWVYQAPAGFKALCDTNLPSPLIAKPSMVMDVKLYTGNGSTQTVSGLGFNPDLVWIKSRSNAYDHGLFDAVRGATNRLVSNATQVEDSQSGVTAFNSDGFSLGSYAGQNGSSATYAAWCWDAGTSTVTNTQGSITSSVRANASAGFSIVTYTGTGTANSTFGHGLGVAPALIITKNRGSANDWYIYHSSLGASSYLSLNTTGAAGTLSNYWSPVNSTVFGQTYTSAGPNNGSQVAYCFAPVTGYSSVSSYVGSGSADGPFVYTGFRPKFIMVKRSDASGEPWVIHDSVRDSYNGYSVELYPNNSNAEGGPYSPPVFDFLSNGFKIRNGTATAVNASGGTFIYMALAESPFQYARAR